jgi:hypothetical protein
MRLLTLPVTIARVPLELGFGAAKQAVKLAQGLVGGGEEPVVEEPRRGRGPAPRRKPARRSTNGRSRPTTSRPSSSRPAASRPTTSRPAASRTTTSRATPSRATPSVTPPPPEPVAQEPAPAPPAAAEPTPAEPAHVSEEPELVAETAEAGAENGAGAEVAVDEPWPGYDAMQAADIEDRLLAEGAETAAAVSLYEASRKGRAAVLEAASRSMTG